MWLPKQVYDLFQVSKENVDAIREELAGVRAERDALRVSEATAKTNFNWLTLRVNALEVERAQLIKKAYNIDVPVPEIVRTNRSSTAMNPASLLELTASLFEDVGDETAKELGLPDL